MMYGMCHGLFALYLCVIGRLCYETVTLPGYVLYYFCFVNVIIHYCTKSGFEKYHCCNSTADSVSFRNFTYARLINLRENRASASR